MKILRIKGCSDKSNGKLFQRIFRDRKQRSILFMDFLGIGEWELGFELKVSHLQGRQLLYHSSHTSSKSIL
jgi:hypothetical protein